jgi:opacity protein-like surface antigen
MRAAKFIFFAGIFLTTVSPGEAVEKGQSGLGFFGSSHIPLFKFGEWYSVSPKVGLNYNYMVTPSTIAEIEYNYSDMSGGDLDMRTFTWSIDDQDYKSPNVSQSMRFHSVMASAQVHTREVGSGGMVPYVTGGLGVYGFSNEISGLIYPGQTGKTLDQNLKLDPYKDEWAALTFSVGGGVTFAGSERILIDIRCRYNMMLGELRPLEDWGLRKAFPIQAIDLSVGIKYFW